MKFIELTRATDKSVVVVNVEQIAYFYHNEQSNNTVIHFWGIDEKLLSVDETLVSLKNIIAGGHKNRSWIVAKKKK